MSRKLQAALRAAKRGWAVLPLHWVEGESCSCDDGDEKECEGSPRRHPLASLSVKDASKDETAIRSWWSKWPKANIGIATGKASKIVVLEAGRGRWDQSLRWLKNPDGKLPACPRLLTPDGKQQFYFSFLKGSLESRFDVRSWIRIFADGDFVVGYGSNCIIGSAYRWKDDITPDDLTMPPLPKWVLKQ